MATVRDGLDELHEAGWATHILGRRCALARDEQRIICAGISRADVFDKDAVLPGVTEVVACPDRVVRFQS
jgi:hypothetical protein